MRLSIEQKDLVMDEYIRNKHDIADAVERVAHVLENTPTVARELNG
jgi:hypothetical protein